MRKVRLFLLFTIFLVSLPAFAHRVNLFCHLEEDVLYCEGYFSGGKPAKNSKVEVYNNESNRLVTTMVTDNEGKFSLPLNGIKNLKIILLAGMGHRAEYILNEQDAREKKIDIQAKIHEHQLDYRKIEEIVERKTKSIHEELIKLKKMYSRPKFSAIVGGVGWIVGIFSLLYLLKKKNAS